MPIGHLRLMDKGHLLQDLASSAGREIYSSLTMLQSDFKAEYPSFHPMTT